MHVLQQGKIFFLQQGKILWKGQLFHLKKYKLMDLANSKSVSLVYLSFIMTWKKILPSLNA